MTSSTASPLLRRPNGRPQACEPCRKRKVACDHAHPICNRCRKRRQTGECVYLVSANSRATPITHHQLPLPPSPAYSSSSGSRSGSGSRPAGPTSTNSPDTTTTDPRSPEGQGPRQVYSGYLGFTSYSAVYEETQISLSKLQQQGSSSSSATPTTDSQTTSSSSLASASGGKNAFTLSPRTRDECLFVLHNVPEASRGKICLRGSPCEAWIYYFLDRVLESFYETFGHYFGPERTDESLEELAVILSKNSTLPFSDDDDISPDDWIAQFSGPRARWETLGLLFGFWDFSVNSITIVKSCTQDEYGRPSQVTKRCLDYCVDMCQEFSPASSMLLFLSYRRLVLDTVLNGDMNRRSWLFLGEVVALLTFLGYHVLPDSPNYQPKFMIEIKRKIYYQIYVIHGTLVSLTGRPPLMSHRYGTTPLPLDLGNQTLFSNDKERLRKAVEAMDSRGWHVGPGVLAVTPMRARAMLALLREEIMCFALCAKRHESVEALLDIKARESQMVEGLPLSVKYHDSDLEYPSPENVGALYWRLLLRLEHLLNIFFIERLLVKHGHPQSELLSVSFDMVTYTLPFWTHQDTLLPLRGDCEWLVMAFGVPAGGILCQELLKPTLHNDPRITRSSLIQKLSLLVGFLDWIKPNAPNGDLCGACKTIIKHVLDQALNAPAPGYESAPGAGLGFDWDFTTQVDFDFDLLDTFGWTRSEPSLSQQVPT